MKSQVRAVVIGGGVVGASVVYHLAKIGWTDVMLLEKSELTSGSTWHAAGGMHTFNGEANISRLQKYTIDLYREIEDSIWPILRAASQRRIDARGDPGRTRQSEAHLFARALSRDGNRDDLARGGEALQSADRRPLFRRRALAGGRRTLRPLGHDACLRRRRPQARRFGRTLHQGSRASSAPRRFLGRCDRQGRGSRRACRQLRGTMGARDRPYGGRRIAGAGDGASLPRHRGDPGIGGPAARNRQHHGLCRRNLYAPGGPERSDGRL